MQVSWDDQYTQPQSIRATPAFNSKPWFDCVRYRPASSGPDNSRYGQLRCIFKQEYYTKKRRFDDDGRVLSSSDDSSSSSGSDAEEETDESCLLALVQCFNVASVAVPSDVKMRNIRQHFEAAGCKLLYWASQRDTSGDKVFKYEVIRLSDIQERVYVVPAYGEGNEGERFYVNVYKVNRQVKDGTKICDKEGSKYNNGFISVWSDNFGFCTYPWFHSYVYQMHS